MRLIRDWLTKRKRRADLQLQIDLIEQRLEIMVSEIDTVGEHLQALDEIVLRVVEMHPGEGWAQAMQNAVGNLDNRTQHLEVVTNACAKLLEELTNGDGGSKVFVFPPKTDKSDVQ